MEEPKLLPVFKDDNRSSADIIFIHGIGGDLRSTWHPKGNENGFWPQWIADDIGVVNVFSLGYPAAATKWTSGGTSMPLVDRAINVISYLSSCGIGERPVFLVTHSLGGLLAKQLLRTGVDSDQDSWKKLANRVKGVVFFATPHSGSDLASIADALRLISRRSEALKDLLAESPYLRDLGQWYSRYAPERGIKTLAFFETEKVGGKIMVVSESSANPNVKGCTPIRLDGDHFEICKPQSTESPAYSITKSRLMDWLRELNCQTEDKGVGGDFFIDNIVQVFTDMPGYSLTFDLVVRNQSNSKVNITNIYFYFNEPLARPCGLGICDVQMVSGCYMILVGSDGATSHGPGGRYPADAWYGSVGTNLRLGASVFQSLPPNSTDRFRVTIEFESDIEIREELETIQAMLEFNQGEQVWSSTISIRQPPSKTQNIH